MIPILLTSTIKPHKTEGIFEVRQSEEERFIEYKRAIDFYRRRMRGTTLVFADNSKSDFIRELGDIKALEVINTPVANESGILGKGFGEGLLINQALDRSKTLQKSEGFIKITGRYRIYNIERFIKLLDRTDRDYDFVALDYQKYASDVYVTPTYMFYSKIRFWNDYMISAYKKVDDKNGAAFERVVTDQLLFAARNGETVGIFPFPALLLKKNPTSGEYSVTQRQLMIGRAKTALALAFRKQSEIRMLEPYAY